MRIYIDESGSFIVPEHPSSRVSCVAALVVPESQAPRLLGDTVALRSRFTTEPEIKGSALTDGQIEAVLWMLGRYDVIVEAAVIDSGAHSLDEIRRLRANQGDKLVASLTPDHHPNVRRQLEELRDEWLRLSEQLVVQLYTTVIVMDSVIRNATLYYGQHRPEELGRFDWIIDPKDIGKTPYERIWERVICPFLQDLALRQPMAMVEGFDYSAFDRFRSPLTEMPEYLRVAAGVEPGEKPFRATDVNKLMRESVRFPDSKKNPGLQLADIVANTLARAMNKKLSENIWRHLGGLTLQKEKGHHSIHAINLAADDVEPATILHEENYYGYVLTQLDRYCKRMLVR